MIKRFLTRFIYEEDGAELIEYAVVVAIVAVLCGAVRRNSRISSTWRKSLIKKGRLVERPVAFLLKYKGANIYAKSSITTLLFNDIGSRIIHRYKDTENPKFIYISNPDTSIHIWLYLISRYTYY